MGALHLDEPQTIHINIGSRYPRGLFFKMTSFSFQRLLERQSAGGRSVQTVADEWLERHGGAGCEFGLDAHGRFLTCMAVPVPFGMLFAMGSWTDWCIPLCPGQVGNGLGLPYVKEFLNDYRDDFLVPDLDGDRRELDSPAWMTASGMQEIADQLRRFHEHEPDPRLMEQIRWMQCRRDFAYLQSLGQTRLGFDMEFLISVLLAGGFLRQTSDIREGLHHAVHIIARDPAFRQHCLHSLAMPRSVPSPTTVRRHRLTLHIAYCRMEAERWGALLDGGMVRWATADASPQHGWELMMHGGRAMAIRDLPAALLDAHALNDRSQGDVVRAAIMKRLAAKLTLSQGTPYRAGLGQVMS